MNGSDSFQVFFDIIIAVFNLGQAGPHFQTLTQARAAAFAVWEIIDAVSAEVPWEDYLSDDSHSLAIANRQRFWNRPEERWHQGGYTVFKRSFQLSIASWCEDSQWDLLRRSVWSNDCLGRFVRLRKVYVRSTVTTVLWPWIGLRDGRRPSSVWLQSEVVTRTHRCCQSRASAVSSHHPSEYSLRSRLGHRGRRNGCSKNGECPRLHHGFTGCKSRRHSGWWNVMFSFRNMTLTWANVVQHYPVDRSNALVSNDTLLWSMLSTAMIDSYCSCIDSRSENSPTRWR